MPGTVGRVLPIDKLWQMDIVQIVPRAPPAVSGLADYSLLAAKQLGRDHNIYSRFICGDADWRETNEIDGFPARAVPGQTAHGLLEALGDTPSTVLLHYVGYGYAQRGCPLWLVDGLERWRAEPGKWLVTVFHELYAFGPPWRSSFWLHPTQKRLSKRLATVSDRSHTTMRRYRRILERFSPKQIGHIPALPVFSTVGESDNLTALDDRKRQMVVFGGSVQRAKTYTDCSKELLRVCSALEIERVVDIGPSMRITPQLSMPVTELGPLPSQEVCQILRDSLAGFVSYFDGYLAKSSIFAAYAAHRVIPVLPRPNHSEDDGLFSGRQYLAVSDIALRIEEELIESIAYHAWDWYSKHSIELTGAALAKAIKQL